MRKQSHHLKRWVGQSVIIMAFMCATTCGMADAKGESEDAIYDNLFDYTVKAFNMGYAWTSTGETHTLRQANEVLRIYTADKRTENLWSLEFFLGLQKAIKPHVLTQIGMAVAASNELPFNGTVLEDADPRFENFVYTYSLRHTRAAIKGKIIAENMGWVDLYGSASVGVGLNRAYDFVMRAVVDGVVVIPNFQPSYTYGLAYTWGIGIQKSLMEGVAVHLGYEYADWGKYRLGRASWQTTNAVIGLNHVHTHQLQFGVSLLS